MIKDRPPRLDQIFQTHSPPLYFVTICTIHRQKIPELETAHQAFGTYIERALREFRVAVGPYVIMPDHIHLFIRGGDDFKLAQRVNGLKRSISVALGGSKKRPLWQPGFFDHVLRNDESYGQKWEYVWEIPVRAGLVSRWDQRALSRRIRANRPSLNWRGRFYTGIVTRSRLVCVSSGFNCRSCC